MRKIWHQLRREGFDVVRCTVARLMKDMDGQGIIRGKPHRTTIPDKRQPCPLDKVNRQFRVPAPNMLWVSDFTYIATWKGFVYVAFVIDASACKIVGWRVSTSPHAGFVLDALEQAVHERRPTKGMGLVHHSDRGSQYLSIKYTERLAEAGHRAFGRKRGRQLRQRTGRDDQRPVQGGGHAPPRPLVQLRASRVSHAGMGRLVQQPPHLRADREHPARRSRSQLLCHSGN